MNTRIAVVVVAALVAGIAIGYALATAQSPRWELTVRGSLLHGDSAVEVWKIDRRSGSVFFALMDVSGKEMKSVSWREFAPQDKL